MDDQSKPMRTLAQRLLALETAGDSAADAHMHEAVLVSEKLRVSLTRFAGPDGFTALLRRSLVLARRDAPSLQAVEVKDGQLAGLEDVAGDAENGGIEAATAVTTHLLALLSTFIGEALTLRLVRQAWPSLTLDE